MGARHVRAPVWPGNAKAFAFDREFNTMQVRRLTRRGRFEVVARRVGFWSCCATLSMCIGIMVGLIAPA